MSDKFGEGRDPYLYPGLDIMRNRLDIRQQQRLEQAAYEMTALRAATIELGPLMRGLPHCVLFIASFIRIFSTGRANYAKLTFIKEIHHSATLPISKKRAMP